MLKILYETDNMTIKYIKDVESRFRVLVRAGERFENKVYKDIMKKIDSVYFKDDILIKTNFGTATLNELSTGCKTVLLALFYAKDKIYVPIDECGENALKVLFNYSEKIDIYVTTRSPIAVFDNNIECSINGEKYIGGQNIYRKLVELCE